jgi:hypothetical protein
MRKRREIVPAFDRLEAVNLLQGAITIPPTAASALNAAIMDAGSALYAADTDVNNTLNTATQDANALTTQTNEEIIAGVKWTEKIIKDVTG